MDWIFGKEAFQTVKFLASYEYFLFTGTAKRHSPTHQL